MGAVDEACAHAGMTMAQKQSKGGKSPGKGRTPPRRASSKPPPDRGERDMRAQSAAFGARVKKLLDLQGR